MSASKTVVLGLAAVLISAVSAQAAMHRKPGHHAMHPMHHNYHHAMRNDGAMRGPAGMANADHSADALNAQSLSRTQGGGQ